MDEHYEKEVRLSPLDSNLIKRLIKVKKPNINEIRNALTYENRYINEFIVNNKNNKQINRNQSENNIDYIEARKFIHKFNKKFKYNRNNYYQQSKETNNFQRLFAGVKKMQRKLPALETDKINYNFCNLMNKYEEKGLRITKEFFNKDIFTSNTGLLLFKDDLNNFYKYDFMLNKGEKGNKYQKNLNFLFKVKRHANQKYNKIILQQKKLERGNKDLIFFNSSNNNDKKNSISITMPTQPIRKRLQIKNKRHNLQDFLNKISIGLKELKEEKEEIDTLTKLIRIEEKNNLYQKRKFDRQNNINNSNIAFMKRKRTKKVKTINPIMSSHYRNNINDQKTELISEENNVSYSPDNLNRDSTIFTNNLNNQNIYQSESTNMTHNNNDQTGSGLNYITDIYRNLNLAKVMRKRLSSVNLLNKFYLMNKSESKTSNQDDAQNNRRGSVEVPRNLKLSISAGDIYEKISNMDFLSYKKNKDKKKERVTVLLKKYYGKKYSEFNMKNNHIKIFNNFIRLKDELIRTENKNEFYQNSADLPKITRKKIEHNLDNEEELKSAGDIFLKNFFNKKLEV